MIHQQHHQIESQYNKTKQLTRSGGVSSSTGYGYAKNRYDSSNGMASANRAANMSRPTTTHSNYTPNQFGYTGSIIYSNDNDRELDNEVASFVQKISAENTHKARAESRAAAQRPLRVTQHGNQMFQNNNNFRGSPSISPVESPSPILAATTSSMRRPGTTSNLYSSRQSLNGRWGGRAAGLDERPDKYMNFEEFRQTHNKLAHSSGSGRSSGYGQNSSKHNDVGGGGSYYERGRVGRKGGSNSNSARYRW